MVKKQWHLMTWREVKEARDSKATVLVPAGTVETQGPFTYVGFEFIVPERLADAVAAQTNAIVTPTIPFGWSADFQDRPGTITLRPETLKRLYEDVVRSVLHHGFDHILLLASHTPNQPMIEEVAYEVRRDSGVRIAWINPGQLANRALRETVSDYDTSKGHGAEPGISLGEFLQPGTTDLKHLVPNKSVKTFGGLDWTTNGLMFKDFPVSMPLMLEDTSPESSGEGDPTPGSAERGERIFAWLVDYTTALVRAFEKTPTRVTT